MEAESEPTVEQSGELLELLEQRVISWAQFFVDHEVCPKCGGKEPKNTVLYTLPKDLGREDVRGMCPHLYHDLRRAVQKLNSYRPPMAQAEETGT